MLYPQPGANKAAHKAANSSSKRGTNHRRKYDQALTPVGPFNSWANRDLAPSPRNRRVVVLSVHQICQLFGTCAEGE